MSQETEDSSNGSNNHSHAHWDHCRPMRYVFPNATARFGSGTLSACQPGHFKDPNCQWDGQYFDTEAATEKVEELTGPWKRFGPFEKAMDYFGDGSFWVVQAPGHMPGNCVAVARTKGGHWICLGSDCCHSRYESTVVLNTSLTIQGNCSTESSRSLHSAFPTLER